MFAMAALPLWLVGCMSAGINEKTVREANLNPPRQPEQSLPALPVVGSADYRTGPLDVLSVDVFQQPDLSREVKVSADGQVALPLVGRIPVSGRNMAELEEAIKTRLGERFLESPQVAVTVKEYLSQRVTLEGAVSQPGVYPLTARMSLLQMIATAGGLGDLANPGACVVYRYVDGKRYGAAFDIREVRAGRMVDPEILGGDVVIVDYSGARANYRDFLSLYPVFSVFLRGY